MPAPYSKDLRIRIYTSYCEGESVSQLSKRFKVSPQFIYNLIKRYQQTGHLNPTEHGGGKPLELQGAKEKYLRYLLKNQPDLTLAQLCEFHYKAWGVHLTSPGMLYNLKKLAITRKKYNFMTLRKKKIMLSNFGQTT